MELKSLRFDSESLKQVQSQLGGPQFVGVGRTIMLLGGLTLAVAWVITPAPSSIASAPIVSALPSGVRPQAVRPRSLQPEITDKEETAQTEAPATPIESEPASERPAAAQTAAPTVVQAVPPAIQAIPPAIQAIPAVPPAVRPATPLQPVVPALPQLVSIAANGSLRSAAVRFNNQTQIVSSGDRVGAWQVQQVRSDQVVLVQGGKSLVLSFMRSANSAPPEVALPNQPTGVRPGSTGSTYQSPYQPPPPPEDVPRPQISPQQPVNPDGNLEQPNNPEQSDGIRPEDR